MIIKAAIIGTHGTFKSTLVNYLSGALKEEKAEVYIVQEIARKCPYELNGVDIRAQKWIVSRQYLKELDEYKKFEQIEEKARKRKSTKDIPRIILCDRSTLDAYIYTNEMCNRQKTNMPGWIPEIVSDNMPTYDFLFLTKITPGEIDDDGIRAIDPEYQKKIDTLLKKYLNKKKINYVSLDYKLIENNPKPSNSDYKRLREAQVEQMVEIISKKWKK